MSHDPQCTGRRAGHLPTLSIGAADLSVLVDAPDLESAALDAAKGAGEDAASELLQAAAIMAASSVVPLLGTAAGAIAIAVKVLGPRIWKGITGAFKTKTNPWVKRFLDVDQSTASAVDRFRTLDTLRVQAKALQTHLGKLGKIGRGLDEYRWARGAQTAAWARMLGTDGYPDLRASLPIEIRALLINTTEAKHQPKASWSRADLKRWVDVQYRMITKAAPFKTLGLGEIDRAIVDSQFRRAAELLADKQRAAGIPGGTAAVARLRAARVRARDARRREEQAEPRDRGGAVPNPVQAARRGKLRSNKPGAVTSAKLQRATRRGRVFGLLNDNKKQIRKHARQGHRVYWVA